MNGWGLPNPGELVSFEKDGVIITDRIESVTYKSAEYIPAPELQWWRKALRAATPPRWRKPLPRGTWTSPTVSVDMGAHPDVLNRTLKTITEMQAVAERLSKGI